jgi:hypothetical protein
MINKIRKFNILFIPTMLLLFFCSILLTIIWAVGYGCYWVFFRFKLMINCYICKNLGSRSPAERDRPLGEKAILRVN